MLQIGGDFFSFLLWDVCRKTSDIEYNTERVFFLLAIIRAIFMGDKLGSCDNLCEGSCNAQSSYGFFIPNSAKQCPCGTETCDSNCLWLI